MTDEAENAEVQNTEAGEAEIKTIDDAINAAAEDLESQTTEEGTESTKEPEAKEPESTETDPAPEHWAKDHKELYSKLKDPEARALVKEFDKTFHQLHQKRMAETVEPIRQAFAPFQEELRSNNMTEAQAVTALVKERAEFMKNMQTNGQQYIRQLAQQYNIPLDDVRMDDENPIVYTLQQQVSELTGRLSQYEQQGVQQRQQAVNSEIEAFASSKDEAGNARYPHFDKVVDDMAVLIDVAKRQGVTMTLDAAYKRAVRSNDDLYQEEVKSELAKVEAQKKADLEKAKKASKHLSGRSPSQTVTTIKTVDDAARAAFEQLSSQAS